MRLTLLSTRIRNKDDFSTLLLLSASSKQSLITLWTASFCPSCSAVAPVIRDVIEKDEIGESEGGVGFAEVEVDAPGLGGLGGEYFVSMLNSWSLIQEVTAVSWWRMRISRGNLSANP